MTTRETFLQTVREAVAQGNRAGAATDLPARGLLGYQGAGSDPISRFREELVAAGGHVVLVPDATSAARAVTAIVQDKAARRIALGRGRVVDALSLATHLSGLGLEIMRTDTLTPTTARDTLFAVDLGISGADYLIAETGTLVIASRPEEPRSLSLLPPVHVAVADRTQILPDLFDLFEQFPSGELPSCLALITGPSKTGDIELRLVTGVHGPGELYVVLITGSPLAA
jgi:L-lactate dehydrogenase complex protein LldG